VTAIDVGNVSAYALESDGSVWAWGGNRDGQLGDGTTVNSPYQAVRVELPAGVRVVALGEAENVGLAIDSTGHAWAWGSAEVAACVPGGRSRTLTPVEVPGISEAVAVQGGGHHTIWLLSGGGVETCGVNGAGQLGVPGIERSVTPVPVPGLSDVVEVSAGMRTSCARTASGAVYDWGADREGQVGNGVEEPAVSSPYEVIPSGATQVSCGGDVLTDGHALALVAGEVIAWGANQNGQLGDGTTQNRPLPTATGLHFDQVVAGGASSYGLDAEGNAWAWGTASGGALGIGPTSARFATEPQLVEGGVSSISSTARNVGALGGEG
jgi:alpha-tubulin suppressor-like RCC1 family protein